MNMYKVAVELQLNVDNATKNKYVIHENNRAHIFYNQNLYACRIITNGKVVDVDNPICNVTVEIIAFEKLAFNKNDVFEIRTPNTTIAFCKIVDEVVVINFE